MIEQFLRLFRHEHPVTMKVLKALPGDKLDFKPHERNMTAGELAWHVAYSQYGLAAVVAAAKLEAYQALPVPASLDEIVAGGETYYQKAVEVVRGLTPEQLGRKVEPVGVPCERLLWDGVLFHQIHHRGQLAIYIRMMGGKVPSIYGPSADENPFAQAGAAA